MEKPVRICMVSPLYHPELGGVGRQAVALTEYLYNLGVKVSVMCRDIKSIPEWNPALGLQVTKIKTFGSTRHDLEAKSIRNVLISLSFSFNLMRMLIRYRNNYDIVHFHGASLPLIFNVLPLKFIKKKIIAKVAGAKMDREAGSFKGKYICIGDIFIRILKNVDIFVAVSSEIRDDLIKDGFNTGKIFKTTNFILPDIFYPERNAGKRREIKKKLNVDNNKTIITFSGRIVPRKRIDILLKAIHEVLKTRNDIQLIILGEGELREKLQRMTAELGIAEYVFFKGFISNILDYLQITDIFVFTSDKEGMPNSLLEAMACRLPVIATEIGGVVDLIENRENGLLIKPGDVTGLKDAILNLLENIQLSEKIAENAFLTIRDRYYIDKVANKYILLYKKVLGEL